MPTFPRLVLSHCQETLVRALYDAIEESRSEASAPFLKETIFVPDGEMKRWLLFQLAKLSKNQSILGLRIIPLPKGSLIRKFCHLYSALGTTQEPELLRYLHDEPQEKKRVALSQELAALFIASEEWGEFPSPPWQTALRKKIPFEDMQNRFANLYSERSPLYLFGLNSLPHALWAHLSQHPSLSIFLFSPCQMFWGDLSNQKERRSLQRYWQKKELSPTVHNELTSFLRTEHPLLSNWGKIGRTTLAQLDTLDLHIEEQYQEIIYSERSTQLLALQKHILCLSKEPIAIPPDDSLEIIPAGSSLLKELELVKERILQILQTTQCAFSEIRILAPDLSLYAPLIPFVFDGVGDSPLPYVLTGVDRTQESFLLHGFEQLFTLAEGRWEAQELIAFLHNHSFLAKKKLSTKEATRLCQWIQEAEIRSDLTNASGSWEQGLVRLLERVVLYQGADGIEGPEIDLLQILIDLIETLPQELAPCATPQLLSEWAQQLQKLQENYLEALPNDLEQEALASFTQFLTHLSRQEPLTEKFSLTAVRYLFASECRIHSRSSTLNAIQFASLSEGTLLPAKTLCLLGMNEEAFPRKTAPSSIASSSKAPSQGERDRYLFLQALFAAKERLILSYLHRSEEGHSIPPSLVVQELSSLVSNCINSHSLAASKADTLQRPQLRTTRQISSLPQSMRLSLSELSLLTRNPLKFYLQKSLGLALPKPQESLWKDFEYSALDHYQFIQNHLSKESQAQHIPLGLFGTLAQEKGLLETEEIQKAMNQFALRIEDFSSRSLPEKSLLFPMSSGLTLQVYGEISRISPQGLLHTGDDSLPSLLKIWPEILIARHLFDVPEIFCLKNGKRKSLQSIIPSTALPLFWEYFLQSLQTPSPLLPDWANALLRQGPEQLQNKMYGRRFFEDPATLWIEEKHPWPQPDQLFAEWSPFLRRVFQPLMEIY